MFCLLSVCCFFSGRVLVLCLLSPLLVFGIKSQTQNSKTKRINTIEKSEIDWEAHKATDRKVGEEVEVIVFCVFFRARLLNISPRSAICAVGLTWKKCHSSSAQNWQSTSEKGTSACRGNKSPRNSSAIKKKNPKGVKKPARGGLHVQAWET